MVEYMDVKLKFSYNTEESIFCDPKRPKANSVRHRYRYEFPSKDGYMFVLTRIESPAVDTTYEFEIEFTSIHLDTINRALKKVSFLFKTSNICIAEHQQISKKIEAYTITSPNPVNIKRTSNLTSYSYTVTNKLDGERFLIYFSDMGLYAYQQRSEKLFKLSIISYHGDSILDTELFKNQYHVFDCYLFKGKSVQHLLLSERLQHASTIVNGSTMIMKIFYDDVLKGTTQLLQRLEREDNDGLIYTPEDPTKRNPILKWKFPEKMSIDFEVHPVYRFQGIDKNDTMVFYEKGYLDVEENDLHDGHIYEIDNAFTILKEHKDKKPSLIDQSNGPFYVMVKKVYQLRVYDSKEKKLVPFMNHYYNGDNLILGEIYEFTWSLDTCSFLLLRKREDKKVPNSIFTAIDVWKDMKEAFTEYELLDLIQYGPSTHEPLKEIRKLHNNYKRELINKFCKDKYVLDLGVGRGGDLFKYDDAKTAFLYCVEPNERNYMRFKERLCQFDESSRQYIELIIAKAQDTAKITNIVGMEGVDVVSSFFSLSFFFFNDNDLDQLIQTITRNLVEGGHFIGTTIDGERTRTLLSNLPNHTFAFKDGVMTLNDDDTVDLKLRGTIVDIQKESLVDFTKLCDKLKEYGIVLVKSEFLKDKDSTFTKDEKIYNSLYRSFVFKKINMSKQIKYLLQKENTMYDQMTLCKDETCFPLFDKILRQSKKIHFIKDDSNPFLLLKQYYIGKKISIHHDPALPNHFLKPLCIYGNRLEKVLVMEKIPEDSIPFSSFISDLKRSKEDLYYLQEQMNALTIEMKKSGVLCPLFDPNEFVVTISHTGLPHLLRIAFASCDWDSSSPIEK